MESAETAGGEDARSRAFLGRTPGDDGGWPWSQAAGNRDRDVAK